MAGYVDPSGSNTVVDFGITPYFVLNDVSGTVIGDGVILTGGENIALDVSDMHLMIPASVLNAFIIDDTSGSLTLSSLAEIIDTDITMHAVTDSVYDTFKTFISESYKATISKRITGKYYGDIGALENDTVFTGKALVTDELIDKIKVAVATAIMDQSNALLVAAEDLLRDLELSDGSGSTTGRSTNSPFVADDILLFNCLVKNGNIELFLDDVASLTDNSNGATFFAPQGNSFEVGLAGSRITLSPEGGVVVNDENNSNVYIYGGLSRFTAVGSVYEFGLDGARQGYVEHENGAVLIRMAIKVVA